MADEVLVAENVTKRYGSNTALRGVSLQVPSGQVFALIGPNGAGKTTLVRCLSGTTAVTAGAVEILGRHPEQADPSRIGLLPQDFTPANRLTARELLTYYANLYEESRPVDDVLQAVGMSGATDRQYRTLSGGQRRRTLVGTALVNDPEVLFLDEPTTGIDPEGRQDVWELIETLSAGGATIFLTSHDMAEVERLADRIGILVEGNLVDIGTPEALLETHGDDAALYVQTGAAETLGETLAGHEVTQTSEGFKLESADPTDIGEVIDALNSAEVTFESVSWRRPNLESIYLDITDKLEQNAVNLEKGRPP